MTWVRSSIKHGARLALFALAIQFVLSFGHFHGIAQATPAIAPGATQSAPSHAESLSAENAVVQDSAIESAQPQPGSDHESDRDICICAVCAVMALANTVLFASPPVVPLPQAVEFLNPATAAEFVQLNSARVPFQPRAPPTS